MMITNEINMAIGVKQNSANSFKMRENHPFLFGLGLVL